MSMLACLVQAFCFNCSDVYICQFESSRQKRVSHQPVDYRATDVYFDSLISLSISFSPQLKTCHQARQTYEINPLVSCESVSVCTSYFKAIVSSDSRHALARLTIPRQLDTRYTNTTTQGKIDVDFRAKEQIFYHSSRKTLGNWKGN